jgi:LPXTG-motif cell wall-anchored protein
VTATTATTTPAAAKASMVGALVVIGVLIVGSIGLAVWRKRRGRVG